ncbi:MAG: hypothetical protein HQK87_06500 [Nitrospinae bacterium]|nr:hypothetical protein [Nitrospinota bacterium]
MKSVSIYTIGKLAEMGIVALVYLGYATQAGPARYGEVAESMLVITYSAFLILGINGSYVKYFSLEKSVSARRMLSSFNVGYNVLLGAAAFGLGVMLIDRPYAPLVGGICALNLMRGSVQTLLRAHVMSGALSAFNVSFALLFGVLFLTVVDDNASFFGAWFAALALSLPPGLWLVIRRRIVSWEYRRLLRFTRSRFATLFKNGVLLAALTFAGIFYLSSDRIILIALDYPEAGVGLYQFADNVSGIFYLVSSSLLYMLTPVYIGRLERREITLAAFAAQGGKVALVWLGVLVLFVGAAWIGVTFFAPAYVAALPTVAFLAATKYVTLILFIPGTAAMAYHREGRLLAAYGAMMLPLAAAQGGIVHYFPEMVPMGLPAASAFALIMVLVISYRGIRAPSHTG